MSIDSIEFDFASPRGWHGKQSLGSITRSGEDAFVKDPFQPPARTSKRQL